MDWTVCETQQNSGLMNWKFSLDKRSRWMKSIFYFFFILEELYNLLKFTSTFSELKFVSVSQQSAVYATKHMNWCLAYGQ